MNNKIVMIKTVGGEFIIGKLDDIETVGEPINNDTIKLTDSRIFNIQMTNKGAAIAFIPPFPFSTGKIISDIEIYKSSIILMVNENDIDLEIINGYKSNISGIDLSASNKIVF
jgi:Icc-related predicted phosphoesterase